MSPSDIEAWDVTPEQYRGLVAVMEWVYPPMSPCWGERHLRGVVAEILKGEASIFVPDFDTICDEILRLHAWAGILNDTPPPLPYCNDPNHRDCWRGGTGCCASTSQSERQTWRTSWIWHGKRPGARPGDCGTGERGSGDAVGLRFRVLDLPQATRPDPRASSRCARRSERDGVSGSPQGSFRGAGRHSSGTLQAKES